MKANHVPRAERLRQRIAQLSSELSANRGPIGKRNPYWECKVCGISDPELSIQGRHWKDCRLAGHKKQIEYYKKLLTEEIERTLERETP